MTTFFKDPCHGPTVFPPWAIGLGFTDVSWHNDAAARAQLELSHLHYETNDQIYGLDLWVAVEDPAAREGAHQGETFPRFMVWVTKFDVVEQHTTDSLFSLYCGESGWACEEAVRNFLSIWNARS